MGPKKETGLPADPGNFTTPPGLFLRGVPSYLPRPVFLLLFDVGECPTCKNRTSKRRFLLTLRYDLRQDGGMAKVRTEHKETLLAMGKWPEFVLHRDELKAGGVSSMEANRLAVLKFLGEAAALTASEDRIGRVSRKAVEKPLKARDSGERKRDSSLFSIEVAGVPPASEGEIPLKSFGGKEASGSEIVLWVIRNLEVAEVKESDCPDPAAWAYLRQCKESPLFKQNFMLQVGLKSLLRIEGEGDGVDASGLRLSETITKLLGFHDLRGSSAVAEREAHALEVAGSTPAPATNLGGV